jgi:type VI secretion system Hcp family effector
VASFRVPEDTWGFRLKTTLASAVLALALLHAPAARAHDRDDVRSGPFFVTIDGITGESKAKGHEGQIEGFNFSETWRQAATTGSTGGGAGKPTLGPVVFNKIQGPASIKLIKALLTGEHIKKVTIEFLDQAQDGKTVLSYRITLQDVLVIGLNEKSLDVRLVDEVQLAFESAKWEVFDPADATSWDGKTNKVNATAPATGRSTR